MMFVIPVTARMVSFLVIVAGIMGSIFAVCMAVDAYQHRDQIAQYNQHRWQQLHRKVPR